MRQTTIRFASAMIAGAFVVLPATAAGVNDWNTDQTAGLTRDEFMTGFNSMGAFNRWDTDKNGVISQSEWQAGVGDRSADFNTRFGGGTNADPYTTWNTDGADGLTMDEFNSGIYSGYDRDRNDIIDEPELGDLGDDIGDGGFWDV